MLEPEFELVIFQEPDTALTVLDEGLAGNGLLIHMDFDIDAPEAIDEVGSDDT